MATEKKVHEIVTDAGFTPLESRCIVVKYAPENLSAKILDLFNLEYYVLQLCEKEIVLLPFNTSTLNLTLKKNDIVTIPYGAIQSVTIAEDLLDYIISIATDDGIVRLCTQQKELSNFRSSGSLSSKKFGINLENWHADNLDATLEALKSLGKS
ncbi:MAG: hypothetical protein Q4D42_08340 [Eubacteriales bacterium]|nr:hypothetical protein [Eubacteriales bacterium]